MQHLGEEVLETGGEIAMALDLTALPNAVTDLYFVMKPQSNSVPTSELKVRITDKCRGRQLSEYVHTPCVPNATVIMCSLSRTDDKKWIVRGLGLEMNNASTDYDLEVGSAFRLGLRAAVADFQGHHLNWERREDIVKLRVLKKLGRITKDSTSDTARLLNHMLDLPVPVFQLVVKWL